MKRYWLALLLVFSAQAWAVERVVSLAPSLSEIVVELGAADVLVGVLDGGDRPAALVNLPSVGRYGQLDMERLLSLKPDLILLWPGSVGPAQREQLRRLNIPVYVAEPHNLEQLTTQVQAIAEQLDRADAGLALADQLRQRLAELRQRYRRAEPLRVFYQVWNQPLYTVGGEQIISDALSVCGARNVFDDLKLPAPQVSIESVLQRDPQLILVGDQAQREAWKVWPTMFERVRLVPDKGLERPSGQMLEAVARLCQVIAPNLGHRYRRQASSHRGLHSKCGRGIAPDGGLRADQDFVSIPVQMWEGACPRWRPPSRPGCWIRPSTYPFLRSRLL
ncbi:Vitamin B12 ABC transporter, B12-binding component BtuF [Pseudomonas orientalis]|nr:Vitamin B12 ABC transporter, B12-binding component BtuF [Pseudomonas orientalis]